MADKNEKQAKKSGLLAKAKDKALEAASSLENVKLVDKEGNTLIDMSQVKEKAVQATDYLNEKATVVKDAALETKEDIDAKLKELDRMLEQAVTDYNDAYTLMNDKGIRLYVERCRAVDTITNVVVNEDHMLEFVCHTKGNTTDELARFLAYIGDEHDLTGYQRSYNI